MWVQGSRVGWFSPSTSFPHWIKVGEEVDAGLLDCNTPMRNDRSSSSEWIPAFSEDKESTLLQGCVRMPTYKGSLFCCGQIARSNIEAQRTSLLEELDTNRFDSYQRERWPGK